MIDDILDYVNTYDDVRALLGVPDDELHNATLALTVYRGHLSIALEAITGTYPLDSVVISDSLPRVQWSYPPPMPGATYHIQVADDIGFNAINIVDESAGLVTPEYQLAGALDAGPLLPSTPAERP